VASALSHLVSFLLPISIEVHTPSSSLPSLQTFNIHCYNVFPWVDATMEENSIDGNDEEVLECSKASTLS
jgi:hypothetical protein